MNSIMLYFLVFFSLYFSRVDLRNKTINKKQLNKRSSLHDLLNNRIRKKKTGNEVGLSMFDCLSLFNL
jgi:hypothetical protein